MKFKDLKGPAPKWKTLRGMQNGCPAAFFD
jgi:hypothetical protein